MAVVKTKYDVELEEILNGSVEEFDTFKELSDKILELETEITNFKNETGNTLQFEEEINKI